MPQERSLVALMSFAFSMASHIIDTEGGIDDA